MLVFIPRPHVDRGYFENCLSKVVDEIQRGWKFMTNWRKRDGCLAFSAVLVLLVVEVLCLRGVIPNVVEVEIICNIVMLAIAVAGLFFLGHPPEKKIVSCVLGNMAVSLMATIMNIDVFGHAIRFAHLVEDLLSWHALWIGFATLQLLVLSSSGKLLLKQIRGILKWGKSLIVLIGATILDIAKHIKESDKRIRLIVIVGILLWTGYFGIQIRTTDVQTVLFSVDFWQKSLLFWLIYLVIAVLIYLLPAIQQRSKEVLLKIDAKKVLAGVICVGVVLILPFIFKVISMVVALAGLLFNAVDRAMKNDEDKKVELSNLNENHNPSQISVRRTDAAAAVIFFVVIPISLVFFIALATPEGKELLSGKISEATAWLEFGNEFLNVTNEFLDLFGLK